MVNLTYKSDWERKKNRCQDFARGWEWGPDKCYRTPKKTHTYLRHLQSFTFSKTLWIGYSFHGFVCSCPLFPRNICLWDLQRHTTRNGSGLPQITACKPQETRLLAYSSGALPHVHLSERDGGISTLGSSWEVVTSIDQWVQPEVDWTAVTKTPHFGHEMWELLDMSYFGVLIPFHFGCLKSPTIFYSSLY